MKKIITMVVLTAMLLCSLGIATSAESYMNKVPATCEYSVIVKKANPAVVKKDGIIDVEGGEYIKADVPLEELSINFSQSENYVSADAMSRTLEYYFSWDDVNGFNFAVKFLAKGTVADETGADVTYDGYHTNFPQGDLDEEGRTRDDFCYNLGLNFASGVNKETGYGLFYYSIAKDIASGSYLTGHWNQLGYTGSYSAQGGTDFVVNYPGDGSVVYEWSIPFANFLDVTAADGVSFPFNITACAGACTPDNENSDNWSVSLGQTGFLVSASKENGTATAKLSSELIKEDAPINTTTANTDPDVTTTAPSNPDDVTTTVAPTNTNVEEQTSIKEVEIVVTNENGETETDAEGNVITEKVTEIVKVPGTTTTSPVTGDPAIIAAVVAAISACGVVVAKKRK